MSKKQKIAVVGATGQIGFGLSMALLKLGHSLVAISRQKNEDNQEECSLLQSNGAEIIECGDYAHKEKLIPAFSGCDTVVVAMRANATIIREVEPIILEAALEAGVKRFVPGEFGCHTLCIDYGDGVIFDAKKDLHQKIFNSGLDWTFVYNGVIFDYMLPNFRMWEKITTFGDVDLTLATHDLHDIVTIAAMSITDDRTKNKAVQICANQLSQREMISMLEEHWPGKLGDIEHISSETIIDLKENSDPNKISAKGGFETDKERHGINYVVYVIGKLFKTDRPDTVIAQELFPDYQFKTPKEALSDPDFVFEKPHPIHN
jgi:putative NADH-flavin reductase